MNRQFEALDILNIVQLVMSMANYEQNITQTDLHNELSRELKEVHAHLEEQDRKIDELLELLKGERSIVQ